MCSGKWSTPGTALVTLASSPIPKHHQTLDNKEEMMQNFLSALNDVSEVFFPVSVSELVLALYAYKFGSTRQLLHGNLFRIRLS